MAEKRTLREVLLYETKANRYAKIYDSGWLTGMCFIDHEDLFIGSLDDRFLSHEVKDIRLVDDEDFKEPIYRIDI